MRKSPSSCSSSVSVGFPSAPQTPGDSNNRTDGALNIARAELNDSRAVAVANAWEAGPLDFIVSGMLGQSTPAEGTTTLTSTSYLVISDFAGQGKDVSVTNQAPDSCDTTNCQTVTVYLNGDEHAQVGGGESITIPYQDGQFDIAITVTRQETAAGSDYVGYWTGVELKAV